MASVRKKLPTSVLFRKAAAEQQAGNLEAAIELYRRALRGGHQHPIGLTNLGEALRRLGQSAEATAVLTRATRVAPKLAPAHYNLALTLDQSGQARSALDAYERALELDPTLPALLAYFVEASRETTEYTRGLAAVARFAPLAPDSARLRSAIGYLLLDVFRLDPAIEQFGRALELDPELTEARVGRASAHAERGEVAVALGELAPLVADTAPGARAHSALLYLMPFAASTTAEAVALEAARFQSCQLGDIEPRTPAVGARAKRRIGYLSAHFREHPLSLFVTELLRHHDRQRVEVHCYSNVAAPDATTRRILGSIDKPRDISHLSDESASDLIVADELDVLIDLDLHQGLGRPRLLARRPAPLQVCFLGYPGTTGLSAVDYRLTDRFLDPPGLVNPYRERQLYIDTYWCYAPPASDPEPNRLPAEDGRPFTFGSLHSFKKVGPETLQLWARVLTAVADSRLVLVAPPGETTARVLSAFQRHGIAASRLQIVAHAPRPRYMRRFWEIDCSLDTWPYSGATSSLDALWMGVPVLSLLGPSATGRAAASIYGQLALPRFALTTADELVERARELAADVKPLAELRATLRERMRASKLMQPERYAQSIEAALEHALSELSPSRSLG